MNIDIKVVADDVCKYCPNMEPVKAVRYDIEYVFGTQIEHERDIWKCKHYDICWGVHKRLQLQMDE